MAEYTLELLDATGNLLLSDLSDFTELQIRLVTNAVGYATVVVPSRFDSRLLSRDARLIITRNGRLVGSTPFLVRAWEVELDRTTRIEAVSANHLLTGRIVAYALGTSQANKTDQADDLMKAVVRENFGALAADADRDISAYLIVAADLGQATTTTRSMSRQDVFPLFQDICRTHNKEIAADVGVEGEGRLYFDVEYYSRTQLLFRTYYGQRGVDRATVGGAGFVELSVESGTLAEATQRADYRDEATVVYAVGQGHEGYQQTAEVEDTTRSGASPFGRREIVATATHTEDSSTLTATATAELEARRPSRILSGVIAELPGFRYGEQWGWGDRLRWRFAGGGGVALVEGVTLTLRGGKETIQPDLRFFEDT